MQLDGFHARSLVSRQLNRALAACLVALALPASALAWGGSYPTGDTLGTSVRIDLADSIPVDETLPQTWAAFFGRLVHGPELASLHLELSPLAEVERVCGTGALACYRRSDSTIFASPADEPDEPSAQEVLIHEYGHHIANNRDNAPWEAEDYGTKRWATYEHVCTRAENGTALPGDEGADYSLNPGEAFAESYRFLNLRAEGVSPIAWDVVDPSFYPDATALSLLEEDVLDPWTGPSASLARGSFGRGATRMFRIATPLDGDFVAHLVSPTKARMQLVLYLSGKPVAHGGTIRYRICGERTLTVGVQRLRGSGSFTVYVSRP